MFLFDNLKQNNESLNLLFLEGDFFVTKHSNLLGTQVVFHLVGAEKKDIFLILNNFDLNFFFPNNFALTKSLQSMTSLTDFSIEATSPLLIGLQNIIHIAAQYDISTLTIPLLLLLGHYIPSELCGDPIFLKRAEIILKLLKSLLVGSYVSTLNHIRFVIPQPFEAHQLKFQALIRQIFATVP